VQKEITQNKACMQIFSRMFKHWALCAIYTSVMVVSMSPYSCALERICFPYADLKRYQKASEGTRKMKVNKDYDRQ
jgi:hypothetical protein